MLDNGGGDLRSGSDGSRSYLRSPNLVCLLLVSIDDAYSGITPFRAAIVCSDFCVCAMVGAKGNLAKTVPSPRSYTQNTRQLGIPLFQRIVSIKVSKQ